eukprot:TRINITY_DN5486_c0_g1_i1.p1 TRINITY_DN5486_c0_g1~~TRINITY_DN5486_c0_g1_i1.p1  ORF type:complete len:161 (+),score=14.55 TRINITY_DN5486_c0_g1_i1:555-1037(+)
MREQRVFLRRALQHGDWHLWEADIAQRSKSIAIVDRANSKNMLVQSYDFALDRDSVHALHCAVRNTESRGAPCLRLMCDGQRRRFMRVRRDRISSPFVNEQFHENVFLEMTTERSKSQVYVVESRNTLIIATVRSALPQAQNRTFVVVEGLAQYLLNHNS